MNVEDSRVDHSEDELIDGVLRRDEDAFRVLYRRHESRLFRFAMRLAGGRQSDAEDLVQETWLRAVKALAGFERRSSLGTWLRSILARCAAERYRARSREDGKDAAAGSNGPIATPSGEARVDLERAFAALPFGFRAVLTLHDVEGRTHREIADLLGISPGTSKSQLSRARRRVREVLGDDYARIG